MCNVSRLHHGDMSFSALVKQIKQLELLRKYEKNPITQDGSQQQRHHRPSLIGDGVVIIIIIIVAMRS